MPNLEIIFSHHRYLCIITEKVDNLGGCPFFPILNKLPFIKVLVPNIFSIYTLYQ